VLDREQQTTLNELRWHWDDAYLVEVLAGPKWTATSLDYRRAVITADSAAVLRELMRHDYASHQPGGCSN
jgi:hypothetical protein